ncbi:hypothetical protein [Candidatus Nitrosocosmicus franklandus]|uniref:Uncharacterized protein n=1 Tax=Candidatus Nitrosocosmicus franklandianus TaxID=1798806 RepID=A0A484ID08_9ARCH|nr:hypothetical protein [Candidatus Nitrosocosmicus franklandus]VFJ14990.1 conserved exported protein of unknown function [Candidatus Nitrosocosmicus franklandus]
MNLIKKSVILGMAPAFLLLVASAITGSVPVNVIAQSEIDPGTPGEVGTTNNSEVDYQPLNLTGPETIEEFESIEGSNADILGNDTNISNTNNTLTDSITVNEQEDCMQLGNQSGVDCP